MSRVTDNNEKQGNESYTQMLWTGVKREAAYSPGF